MTHARLNVLLIVLLSVLISVYVLFGTYTMSKAQGFSGTYSFGGKILAITPCPFSGGVWVVTGLPRPSALVYTPGISQTFSYGPPASLNQQLLGKALPEAVPCSPIGPYGTPIIYHGSSLPLSL